MATLAVASSPCLAQDASISLVSVTQGSSLSETARSLSNGSYEFRDDGTLVPVSGYELQDGTWVSFEKWYRTDWVGLQIDFLTQFNDDLGLLWGLGTGERGEKYTIDPSLKVGLVAQAHPQPNSTVSLTVTSILGGRLNELPCIADYGDIGGGEQEVNCRLAATRMPPEETLKYLVKADPSRLYIALGYRANF